MSMDRYPSLAGRQPVRSVPIRDTHGSNVQRNREALAAMDECERLCGKSAGELIEFHRVQRARVLARAGIA